MERWRDLEQRMLSYGGDMPADLLARVDEVESWLSGRESDAAGGAVQWMNRLLGLPEHSGLTAVAPGWT